MAAPSDLENGEDLSLGNHVIEIDENGFDFPAGRRRHRDFHFHGLDKGNIVAFADAGPGLDGKRADAAGNLGDNLDLAHPALRLPVVAPDCPM